MHYFDNIKPPPARPLTVVPTDTPTPTGGATPYAAAALRGEAEVVATAPPGTRNDALNRAWFRMGRHIGAGNIDTATVRAALTTAARTAGLPDHEITLVLRDDSTGAAAAGAAHPRIPPPLPELTVTVLDDQALTGDQLEQPSPLLNPVIDWHELFATDDDGEDWILEPLLPARRMIALYSAPKAGKSLLMLEVAVGIATGTTTLGATPDGAHRVLYVDFENDPRGDIRARLEAMDIGPHQLDNLCYLTYPALAKFDTAQGADDLMRHVEHYDCDVVVIDTVSRAVAGEENENDTWLSFYRHTGLALKRAGVACIRLDHSGKDRDKGMRGGSAKYGDVDAVWRLTPVGDDTVVLDCTDNRMPVPTKQLTLVREEWPLRHRHAGEAWQVVADARTREADQLLDALQVPTGASVRDAKKAIRSAGYSLRNEAIEKAVQARKTRLDAPLPSVPGTPGGHLGTAGGSVPQGPPPKGALGTPPVSVPAGTGTPDDVLVSCRSCFRPTTTAVARLNDGRCATCHRATGQTIEEHP